MLVTVRKDELHAYNETNIFIDLWQWEKMSCMLTMRQDFYSQSWERILGTIDSSTEEHRSIPRQEKVLPKAISMEGKSKKQKHLY